MTWQELDVLLNAWPTGTQGNVEYQDAIAFVDMIGKKIGYGALSQLAEMAFDIQCNQKPSDAIELKRTRFTQMEWPLPDGFEELAAKAMQECER